IRFARFHGCGHPVGAHPTVPPADLLMSFGSSVTLTLRTSYSAGIIANPLASWIAAVEPPQNNPSDPPSDHPFAIFPGPGVLKMPITWLCTPSEWIPSV